MDFDLFLPNLYEVGEVVPVDLTALPHPRALRSFRTETELALDYLRRTCDRSHRCCVCASHRQDATDEERFEFSQLPLVPLEDQIVLVHVVTHTPAYYIPGDPPLRRPYRHTVTARRRRYLEEMLDGCDEGTKATPFFATARPACAFTFDWAALAALIQLAEGGPSDIDVLDEYLHLEGQPYRATAIDRNDLRDYLAGDERRVYRRAADAAIGHEKLRKLGDLRDALAAGKFDDLRSELSRLPADAFAYQAPI
jgi:hypothetical protein